jgi:hypothetical protein
MRVTPRFVPILLALCLPGAVAAAQTPVAFPAGLEELWEGGDRCGEPRAEQWAWTFGMDYRLAAEVASRAKVIPRIEPHHAEWTIVGGGIGTRMAVSSARAAGATTAEQVVAGLTQLGDEAVGELTGVGPRDVADLGRLARERLAPRPPGGSGSGPSEVMLVTEASDHAEFDLRPLSDPSHRLSRSVDPTVPSAGTRGPGGTAVPRGTANPVLGKPRVGSALKSDTVKPIRDAQGKIVQEFPATPRAHGFPDVVDNFAGEASQFQLRSGATLYQVEGSFNGVAGRFEWIVDSGQVTHRMFVGGGTVNGIPITP